MIVASNDNPPPKRKRTKKARRPEEREPHGIVAIGIDTSKGADPYAAHAAWLGELCARLIGTCRSGDDDPGLPRAWDRVVEYAPIFEGDTAETYSQRMDDSVGLLLLISKAWNRPGAFDLELHEVAELAREQSTDHRDPLLPRRRRFMQAVEHCVIEHGGDAEPLERVLSELDPGREHDLAALRRAMRRLSVLANAPRARIRAPLMAATAGVAGDVFGDRNTPQRKQRSRRGEPLSEAKLIDLARKCFLKASRQSVPPDGA